MTEKGEYIKNPLTGRVFLKDEKSRVYKDLLKKGLIEGEPIQSKRRVKKEYKFKPKIDSSIILPDLTLNLDDDDDFKKNEVEKKKITDLKPIVKQKQKPTVLDDDDLKKEVNIVEKPLTEKDLYPLSEFTEYEIDEDEILTVLQQYLKNKNKK